MFYSHEVLTSHKHGVATVWLVATLGQKSTARKVSRRAILDVDVPKACETIITPEAPMALRLQSNLLYGISRVYSKQCGYVLTDVQHAQSAIRALHKIVRTELLNSETAKAKPGQITLQDDPAFVPGIGFSALDSDLLDLGIGGAVLQRHISDTGSLQTTQSQQVPSQISLRLPNSPSLDIGGFTLPGSGSSGPRPGGLRACDEEDVLLPKIDIGIDADGNFIDFDNTPQGRTAGSHGGSHDSSLLPSESGVEGGPRRERQTDYVDGAPLLSGQLLDSNLLMINDGYNIPPPEAGIPSDGYREQKDHSDTMTDPSSIAMAPQRRKIRMPKAIPLDRNIELRNRDLLAMNTGYTAHMAEDWKRIAVSKATAQAKQNANYWLLGKGITGVGDGLGRNGIKGPLAEMWSGDNLYLILTGRKRVTKGKKREGEDEDTVTERRVRPRLDFDGDRPAFQLDDTLMRDYELEVGREGQEPLEDISSAMPWNISASIRGSSVTRAIKAATGIPGSIASSLTYRSNRIVNASPVIDHGATSGLGAAEGLSSDTAGFADLSGLVGEDEFELYGPAAGVNTQITGQSQWQKATLDRESNNFLDFIANAVDEKRTSADAAGLDAQGLNDIEFEELLPPQSHSRTVAAQALLHVLTLGTKKLIQATQKEPFASIALEVC